VRQNVTDKDRLFLLRATSDHVVRNFLNRQPAHTQSSYQLTREALIQEFADPDAEPGLVAAFETKQGRHESPHAYYNRLRQAYFGSRNEPEMEEELHFKTLFLRNLHPGVSHHLGVLACPRTMAMLQLRDLAHKAYSKQKMDSERGTKPPAVFEFNTQHQGPALEGTQHHDSFKPSHRERQDPPVSREQNFSASARPEQPDDHWHKQSSDSQEFMQLLMREFFRRNEEDRKWDKSDSAWQASTWRHPQQQHPKRGKTRSDWHRSSPPHISPHYTTLHHYTPHHTMLVLTNREILLPQVSPPMHLSFYFPLSPFIPLTWTR
ncbi:MAG: hypothetical protein ACRCW3_04000, partial [Metamycoplasmataceae bacterium]